MKFLTLMLQLACLWLIASEAGAADFQNSYAIVVGIDDYASVHKQHLSYARKDAQSIADYLRNQGYVISEFYDQQATKHDIIAALHSLAVKLRADDRVVVFMAGHGANERIGDELWGYFIPYDGRDTASYISYTELQDASRQMSAARHQLFIMDACFSGLMLKTRTGGVSPEVPNYIDEVTKRITREALAAGGEAQEVLDSGPDGHSVFTGALLKGLNGAADLNMDGYITFAELESYIIPLASNRFQTPAAGVLPGNGGGEFVFPSPLRRRSSSVVAESVPRIILKRSDTDELARAKELLKESRFSEALPLFQKSASTDNVEALFYMGRMYQNGWGVEQGLAQARRWYQRAAAAGSAEAAENLKTLPTNADLGDGTAAGFRGIHVVGITPVLAMVAQVDIWQWGVYVTSVDADSPFANTVAPNSVITYVNEQEVRNVEDFKRFMYAARNSEIRLFLKARGQETNVVLPRPK